MGSWANHQLLLAVVAGSLLVNVGDTHAALVATEDNNVRKSEGDIVQNADGTATSVALKHASTSQGNARLGYFKFDLSSVLVSDGNDATFTVTTSGSASTDFGLAAYVLNDGVSGFDWSEGTITYNTRPAYSNSGFLLEPTAVTAMTGSPTIASTSPAGTKASFSLTGLSDYRQSDESLTIMLIVTGQIDNGPSLSVASSEHATASFRPTLTVVPEPATAGLLGLGAAGILLRRRRRV